MTENELAAIVVDTSLDIHRRLGPGLLESAYEAVVAYELGKRGLIIERQVPVPLVWDELVIAASYRIDILVDNKLIVELKSIEKVLPVHIKQVLTYLKVSNLKLGLLINFGAAYLKDGITRLVNNLEE